jgi:hypothetical protein
LGDLDCAAVIAGHYPDLGGETLFLYRRSVAARGRA